ncbi:MAG: tryptophan synthase subunit alpha [Pirellulaceae bacterium]|nr:tryptophan synthase subunit alpha [Pirellulaceae bacterium]
MSAIDKLFSQLRAQGRKAFMPFVTAGDPDLDFTEQLLRRLHQCGASLFEIGLPYSDPIADGPVIQTSFTRALDRGVKLSGIFEMLGQVTQDIESPVVTMGSYAIIHRHGLEAFVAEAKGAGVAGAIVPDLPVEESDALADVCRREDFSLIQLVTPTTPPDRAKKIAERSSGFLYFVSVTGITGERTELPPEIADRVAWLREQTDLPICIGFGISRPEHVRMLAPVADGLIVGSAIVRRAAEASQRSWEDVLSDIDQYAAELLLALNG